MNKKDHNSINRNMDMKTVESPSKAKSYPTKY